MADSNDLSKLLDASASGDRAAFERLYHATHRKLFGIALRILQQPQLAEDALQATYLNVWRNSGGYRSSRGTPMTWLIAIARNQALDRRRRRKREVLSGEPENWASAVDITNADPMGDTVSRARSRALEECLEALRPEQRRCIELAYCDGFTHQELSRRLDTSLGTVKSWIRRGLLSLKACLES